MCDMISYLPMRAYFPVSRSLKSSGMSLQVPIKVRLHHSTRNQPGNHDIRHLGGSRNLVWPNKCLNSPNTRPTIASELILFAPVPRQLEKESMNTNTPGEKAEDAPTTEDRARLLATRATTDSSAPQTAVPTPGATTLETTRADATHSPVADTV